MLDKLTTLALHLDKMNLRKEASVIYEIVSQAAADDDLPQEAKDIIQDHGNNLKNIIKDYKSDLNKVVDNLKQSSSNRPPSSHEQYYIENKDLSLTVETKDGKQHTIKALDISSGWYDDSAQGGFTYSIDDQEHEWEFHSGWYADGAAWRILEDIGEDGEENNSDEPTEIEEAIESFLESQVKENPNYRPSF